MNVDLLLGADDCVVDRVVRYFILQWLLVVICFYFIMCIGNDHMATTIRYSIPFKPIVIKK